MDQASPLEEPAAPGRRGSGEVLPLVAAVAAVLFYVLPFAVRHILMPQGDDAIYWVLALRVTAKLGLVGPQVAARPAFPLIGSMLGTATGSSAWTIAVAAPIAMAAATGLAGAAVAARWGLRRWGLTAFAILSGVSGEVARLVAGKDENLMALWLMAAALAVPAWSAADPRARRPGLIAAGALVGVMTLVEWPLAVTFAAIVVAAWALAWIATRIEGTAQRATPVARPLGAFAIAVTVGLVAGVLAIVLVDRVGPGSGIQNLPPGYRYAARLRDELSLIWPWLTGGLTVLGVAAAWGRERRPAAVGFVAGVWLIGTAVVVALGWMGVPGPTYRALTIALPVVLATAAAAFLPFARRRDPSTRAPMAGAGLRWGLAVFLAAAALIPGISLWWRAQLGTPTTPGQLSEVTAAVRYAESLPGGTPVVLVASQVELPFAQSLLYQRMAAAAAPPNADPRVLVFVGRARDALAGRPTTGLGSAEDQVSRDLFGSLRPALAAGAPILSGRELDPIGFQEAVRAGAPTVGGGLVAVVRGPRPAPELGRAIDVVPLPSAWHLFVVAIEMLVVFALTGVGWTGVTMRGAAAGLRWLVAPAFGAASLALVSFVLVHVGVQPSEWGAWLSIAIALGAGLAAWRVGARPARPVPEPSERPVAPSPL